MSPFLLLNCSIEASPISFDEHLDARSERINQLQALQDYNTHIYSIVKSLIFKIARFVVKPEIESANALKRVSRHRRVVDKGHREVQRNAQKSKLMWVLLCKRIAYSL